MKKELKTGILSADHRPIVGGVNVIAVYGFIWENVTMMDSFEIIASCDLELVYAVNLII